MRTVTHLYIRDAATNLYLARAPLGDGYPGDPAPASMDDYTSRRDHAVNYIETAHATAALIRRVHLRPALVIERREQAQRKPPRTRHAHEDHEDVTATSAR